MVKQESQILTFETIAQLRRETVQPDAIEADTKYVGLEHIGEGSLSLLGIGIAQDVSSAKSRFHAGDVLFGKLRPYFRKVIRPRFDGVCSTDIWVVVPKREVNAGFLFYLMASQSFVDLATQASEGTKMPRAKWEYMATREFLVPPLPEQRAIAHILGTLDDKIELNRRMNETLEGIARALFKSWFVDFDPVRAKAEGRVPYGMDAETAALFPDSFEDSELGEIPAGWPAGTISDIAIQTKTRLGQRVARVLSAVSSGRLVASDEQFNKQVYSEKMEKYLAVEPGDFAYNPSRINIGSIGMNETDQLGVVSPVYVVTKPDSAYRWFLRFFLDQPTTRNWISSLSSGSVRQSLSYRDFASIPCVVPPIELAKRFDSIWEFLRNRSLHSQRESQTLATLRDTLLPKLISGELRVSDAENLLADSTL